MLSICIYYIQYTLYHDSETTVFYFLQDLAFVPVQVVMVTLILNRFLSIIESRKKAKKINVIISTFFVEAGISVLTALAVFNRNNDGLRLILGTEGFDRKKAVLLKKQVREFGYDIEASPENLRELVAVLDKYRDYMLNMLGNDNLLEHDSFTDMLWAAFHVADELKTRDNLDGSDQEDLSHLANDILRAYMAMNVEWINYMSYLHDEYPFLYAMAIKKNPY